MEWKYVLAAILVAVFVSIVAFGNITVDPTTGLIVTAGGSPEVRVEIDNGRDVSSANVALNAGESAFDALKRVAVVDYEMYATGIIISGINGVKADGEHYWICLVNGELPENGCDFYNPKDGDVISYRYLTAGEVSEYFT